MNLKKGLFWTGLLRVVVRSFSIIKILVIARILTPSQFGLFGVASLALGILETFSETGVNVVLIQDKKPINYYLNTAWVVSILRGVLISLLIILSIPAITIFFNTPQSATSLYLIAIIPFIKGFINPAIVNYQKNLEFNKEFTFRSILTFSDLFSSVFFAFLLKNELSLGLGMITASLLEVILSFYYFEIKPRFEFDFEKLKSVLSKGKWVTGAKIFDYLFSHSDDLVVGKMLGVYSLGLYQQAYKISTLPITEVTETFQKVTFPIYSKNILDKGLIKKTYFKSLLLTILIVTPMGLVFYLFPTQIITLLLGDNWLSGVSVLKVLAIFGIIKTIANSAFPLLLAYKRQDLVMYLTLIGIIGLGLTIFPLVNNFNLVGAGISTIIGSLVMIPPAFYWISKTLR